MFYISSIQDTQNHNGNFERRWSWENHKHPSLHTSPKCQSNHLENSSAVPSGPYLANVPLGTPFPASRAGSEQATQVIEKMCKEGLCISAGDIIIAARRSLVSFQHGSTRRKRLYLSRKGSPNTYHWLHVRHASKEDECKKKTKKSKNRKGKDTSPLRACRRRESSRGGLQ